MAPTDEKPLNTNLRFHSSDTPVGRIANLQGLTSPTRFHLDSHKKTHKTYDRDIRS